MKDSISAAVKLLANGGHVLVKYKNRLFLAEKDNINPEKNYVQREITYHPHQDKFII